MHITLSPQFRTAPLILNRAGSVLTFDGLPTDLASYALDEMAPHDWIVGQPALVEGVWHVEIILPHGADAPEETRFPAPLHLTADGPVTLPIF